MPRPNSTKKDCYAECKDCDGNFFRYVDWTQNPTPFEPIPPCPSKEDEEAARKRRLAEEMKRKKLQEEAEGTIPLLMEDLGIDEANQDDKDFLWQQEMDALTLEEPEEPDEDEEHGPAQPKLKWWEKLFGPSKKRAGDSLWTDEYQQEEGPETEVGDHDEAGGRKAPARGKLWTDQLQEEPETEESFQKKSEGQTELDDLEKRKASVREKLWSDEQKEKTGTEKDLQEQSEKIKRKMQGESEDMQTKPVSTTGRLWLDQQEEEPETERELQEQKRISDIQRKVEGLSDKGILPEGRQRDVQDLAEGLQTDSQELSKRMQRDVDEGSQEDGQVLLVGAKSGEQPFPVEIQKDARILPEGAQGDVQGLPDGIQRGEQTLPAGMQGDASILPEDAFGDALAAAGEKQKISKKGLKRTRRLPTGLYKSDKEVEAERRRKRRRKRRKRDKDKKKKKKSKSKKARKYSKFEDEDAPLEEITLLAERQWRPGDLDDATKKNYQIEDMWYRVQSDRFMPLYKRPLSPHWRWHTSLKIKHFVQKIMNPLDTVRARMYIKDDWGPIRGRVVWQPAGRGGWGCGCPALPCICHLHHFKPPQKIPKGASKAERGAARSRLLQRVAMRVRVEERLHEKLADLPPPTNQPPEPLFCAGLAQCVARQALAGPLVRAALRTRLAAVRLFPCDPDCGARCSVAYADTVRMLRLQAAGEVLGKPVSERKQRGGFYKLKLTSTRKDMEYLREKCAEIREGVHHTKVICYRMEEVRVGGRGVFPNLAGAPVSASSAAPAGAPALTPESAGERGGPRRHRRGHEHRRRRRAEGTSPQEQTEKQVLYLAGGEGKSQASTASGGAGMMNDGVRGGARGVRGKARDPRGEARDVRGGASGAGLQQCSEETTTRDPILTMLSKDATQSTTEISSSLVFKNRPAIICRRKTRWEKYKDSFENVRRSLKDVKRSLAPASGIWKLNNLKYWLVSCCLPPASDVTSAVCPIPQGDFQEDLFPHLAQLIQEQERYRNVLMLRNYLITHNFSD